MPTPRGTRCSDGSRRWRIWIFEPALKDREAKCAFVQRKELVAPACDESDALIFQDVSYPGCGAVRWRSECQDLLRAFQFLAIPKVVIGELPNAVAHAVDCRAQIHDALGLNQHARFTDSGEKVDVIVVPGSAAALEYSLLDNFQNVLVIRARALLECCRFINIWTIISPRLVSGAGRYDSDLSQIVKRGSSHCGIWKLVDKGGVRKHRNAGGSYIRGGKDLPIRGFCNVSNSGLKLWAYRIFSLEEVPVRISERYESRKRFGLNKRNESVIAALRVWKPLSQHAVTKVRL